MEVQFTIFYNELHQRLRQPIAQEEYYNDKLSPGVREVLTMAFQLRCATYPDQLLGDQRFVL